MNKKRVIILGSTGSIGKNAIKVLRNLRNEFEIVALTAHSNFKLLAEQAAEFQVKKLVLADKNSAEELKKSVSSDTTVYCDENAASEIIINDNIDIVLCAIIGTGGFIPVLNAIRHNKRIALASKEVYNPLADNLHIDFLPSGEYDSIPNRLSHNFHQPK